MRDNDLLYLPPEIGKLARLKELHIQGNRLTVLPPELGRSSFASLLISLINTFQYLPYIYAYCVNRSNSNLID